MICILPEWAAQVLTFFVVVGGLATGLTAFSIIAKIGERRHPEMDYDGLHHRRWWGMGGVLLGLFAFSMVTVLLSSALRPVVCDMVGTYQPPPDYSWP